MGYIRTRANGQLVFVFSWKGKKHTKGLGTTDEHAAQQIRQDANDQLDRIRKGENRGARVAARPARRLPHARGGEPLSDRIGIQTQKSSPRTWG